MVALDGDDGEFFVAGGYGRDPMEGGWKTLNRAFIHRGNNWDDVAQMATARASKRSNNVQIQVR